MPTDSSPKQSPAFVKVDSASRSSEQAMARIEHYREAYLNIVSPDNFDRDLWMAVKCVKATMGSDGKTGRAKRQL